MSHFLKRLELNGFKSFADRTSLEFPAGIVAIVGPNGSGKSNIVDALRWLLGERDAKNLRGGKGEDLIFAGSQKRTRVGQATASLYFDNTKKFFPAEFEEVVVTREIRRDGQSKYFLNRSEVLLRDLIDFFAKARLGSRGLVIVGQGDSDLFVRSTPLERRAMIEEILGLREYQIKKADAERRLKNSRVNLDKARALVTEIVPHLRSLKRQTGRWERRGELQAELVTLENQFFGHQLKELSVRQESIKKVADAGTVQRKALEENLQNVQKRQAMIESSRPEEQKDLQAIRETLRTLAERKSTLQKDIGRLEAQIEMAQKAAVKNTSGHSVERFVDLVAKIRRSLEEALHEGADTRSAIQSVLHEIKSVMGDDKEVAKMPIPTPLTHELEKITKDLHLLDDEMATLRKQEGSFENSQEEFYKTFKAAVEAVQQAKNAIDSWERANRENDLENERITLRREEIFRQIEQAGRRAEEFKNAETGSLDHAAAAEMERKIFRLRGDLASIGEVDEALLKEANDTESRYAFLMKESEDLEKAVADLTKLMIDLTEKIAVEFEGSLRQINEEFHTFFDVMFGGGSAKLKILKKEKKVLNEDGEEAVAQATEEDDGIPEDNGGVEIEIKLPRKKINSLDMLSGGERSLVGIAALFALVAVSPPPFLVLDEIDAPLDERNARRFAEMLKNFSKRTQFIVVTHNRATMEAADILYGVTLNEDGTSKMLSMKFEAPAETAKQEEG